MKKVLILVGTRPNFIKVTRFKEVAAAIGNVDLKIVHTGQHFDEKMADVFFEQFNLKPDYFLKISASSPNTQMAEIMLGLEKVVVEFKPDVLIVPGDVNSTLAGAITANKCGVKLAHLESGLRSFDNTMPEEINRILTDRITDLFFVTEKSGLENIKAEKLTGKVHFVGNTMIDTLVKFETQIESSSILSDMGLEPSSYLLMTIHRSSNVDDKNALMRLIELVKFVSKEYKVVFPIHPRTIKFLKEFNLYSDIENNNNVILSEPMGYFEFQKLIKYAKFILTDSGGIQEESTYRKIPCLTLRENTERPITVDIGTNTLVPFELNKIQTFISQIESGNYKKGKIPEFWDGYATERIMEILCKE